MMPRYRMNRGDEGDCRRLSGGGCRESIAGSQRGRDREVEILAQGGAIGHEAAACVKGMASDSRERCDLQKTVSVGLSAIHNVRPVACFYEARRAGGLVPDDEWCAPAAGHETATTRCGGILRRRRFGVRSQPKRGVTVRGCVRLVRCGRDV